MIVVTGAAGFIGSCMTEKLNESGRNDLILVDDFTPAHKKQNWIGKSYTDKIARREFFRWAEQNAKHIDAIIHLGARTDTTEMNYSIFEELNVEYTQHLWSLATQYNLPLLYASSAATYGNGELGYDDDESLIPHLQPLNPYGKSKQMIDNWILTQKREPSAWAGFKFFNVYGPNEYHKGRMSSVILHAFDQINETGSVNLFRSHRPEYRDGEQKRDFIYVKDVVSVLYNFTQKRFRSGIYNLGTGKARTFYDLAAATFAAMDKATNINYVDIPEDIRDKYQYFTEAKMDKLQNSECHYAFTSLEAGVTDYVQHYLMQQRLIY